MKAANSTLISTLLVGLLIAETNASAKGVTTKITITDLTAGTSVEVTNPNLLEDFSVWAGPGTFSSGVEAADGFIIDWRSGIVTDRPSALRQYEISFYSASPREPSTEPEYVVLYESDLAARRGYVYLPGKTDRWYATNIRAIYRGNEGHWFRASDTWQKAVGPVLLSPSAVSQQSLNPASCLHGSNESAIDHDRRTEAIRFARVINTAEANAPKPFRPLSALNAPIPAGWEARLVTDGSSYAFSVKDSTDPCGFTLFSDDSGLIYQGSALR